MGLYSSWPAMALTNHVFARLAAARLGIHKFDRYQIIGDDIVIFDYEVAKIYINILDEVGVKYNNDDTIWPYKDTKPYEIAKRLFRSDNEVSPINVNLFNTNLGLYYHLYMNRYVTSEHISLPVMLAKHDISIRSFTAALLLQYYTSVED
jgi:hypothetical protein